MKDLQAIIDQRAEDKLNKDIDAISNILYQNRQLLNAGKVYLPKGQGEFKEVELSYILGTSDGFTVRYSVFNDNIEKYKEVEAENFIKEVEELKNRVANLNNEISFLQ